MERIPTLPGLFLLASFLSASPLQPYLTGTAHAQGADAVWDTLAGPIDPTPAYLPQAVYDPARRRMVIVDGLHPSEVWTLSLSGAEASTWDRLLIEGPTPNGRLGFAAVYDSLRDRILVFGGGWDGAYNDLWALSLADRPGWSPLAPLGESPPAGGPYSAIFDPTRNRMVLFSGSMSLWELDLAAVPTWRRITPAGQPPPPRGGATAVFDPWNDRMVFFGGYQHIEDRPCYGNLYSDTWSLSFSGTPTWARLSVSPSPPGRVLHSAVIDPVRRQMVVHGGRLDHNCTPERTLGDTWAFHLVGPPSWAQLATSGTPPDAVSQTAIYSPERGSMIRFEGSWDTCFELDLEVLAWAEILPPAPDVLDIMGRRVARADLSGADLRTGRIDLGETRSLSSGLYFVRLTQGTRSLTTRTVIIR